ncbi:hypothetical protein GGR43_001767 [Sphingobium jiangsuense]|uniref:Uncharacterized protein n=1 Tax=Sphingobium jiangsuense TaxID=870476 RepID=A0A7W6FPW8_9SPHN|nr:hypothetical protein [Sphingobium jiangsuense]
MVACTAAVRTERLMYLDDPWTPAARFIDWQTMPLFARRWRGAQSIPKFLR